MIQSQKTSEATQFPGSKAHEPRGKRWDFRRHMGSLFENSIVMMKIETSIFDHKQIFPSFWRQPTLFQSWFSGKFWQRFFFLFNTTRLVMVDWLLVVRQLSDWSLSIATSKQYSARSERRFFLHFPQCRFKKFLRICLLVEVEEAEEAEVVEVRSCFSTWLSITYVRSNWRWVV